MMRNKGFVQFVFPTLLMMVAVSGALIYKYCYKAPNDNPVEEAAERVIKAETGIDFDLSPDDSDPDIEK